jgi:glycosyltransferase involved in cell wall biosynthesis
MSASTKQSLHIVFLHLDLGIGGAEQLVVNLALASLPFSKQDNTENTEDYLNAKVSIFTTHCDQSHCFDAVRHEPNPGRLANSLHIVGSFIPVNLFGYGTVFFSTLRMLYLSFIARWTFPNAVFVLDVLPTPIPFLVWSGVRSVIYYCHFPDKLLTRDTVNGIVIEKKQNGFKNTLKCMYRAVMDKIEEWSMSYADVCCVNSDFTKREVLKAFPQLNTSSSKERMHVLYPAIDLKKFIAPDFESKKHLVLNQQAAPIVSLNRFERKKNIQVLIEAYAILQKNRISLPNLIISGGYDPRNSENVQYIEELKAIAKKLDIQHSTIFKPSISDKERAELLQSAICVVYTPYREHFGIVPLEAMYAGSAVVAGNSGGPIETVINGKTGILVDMKPGESAGSHNLANAMNDLLQNKEKAVEMGQSGHKHVKEKFGLKPFRKQWKELILKRGIPSGMERKQADTRNIKALSFLCLFIALYVAAYSQK